MLTPTKPLHCYAMMQAGEWVHSSVIIGLLKSKKTKQNDYLPVKTLVDKHAAEKNQFPCTVFKLCKTKWFLLWCLVTPLWMKTTRVAGGPSGSCTSPCFSAAWVRMLNSHHGVYMYSLLCHTCVKFSNKPVHNVFSFRIYHCHHITVALSATGVYYFTDSVKITKIFG